MMERTPSENTPQTDVPARVYPLMDPEEVIKIWRKARKVFKKREDWPDKIRRDREEWDQQTL